MWNVPFYEEIIVSLGHQTGKAEGRIEFSSLGKTAGS